MAKRRVKIVSVAGQEVFPGLIGADPQPAQENMDQLGWMEDTPCPELGGRLNPRIELDNGEVIWGYQCWWDYADE